MPYDDKLRPVELPHNLILENRSKLSLSGGRDVESFDESEIIVNTAQGDLIVRGEDLHVEKLNLDSGDVILTGSITGLEYEESARPSGGFMSRLFK